MSAPIHSEKRFDAGADGAQEDSDALERTEESKARHGAFSQSQELKPTPEIWDLFSQDSAPRVPEQHEDSDALARTEDWDDEFLAECNDILATLDPQKTALVAVGEEHPPVIFRIQKNSSLRTLVRAYSRFRGCAESTEWSVRCMPCTSTVDLSQPAQVLPVLQRIAFAKVPREIVEKETNETAEPEARESSCHGTRLC
ncbi:unnamed protein product [Cladocopium goreaui]|uniref:Uncharacterized protein n=1 Tax=Cladocopium goreaui TaxID=2562237 RepID=A0A9P1C4C6_9DINO|nr:unnamed protein product [Cladocopium goreaui]